MKLEDFLTPQNLEDKLEEGEVKEVDKKRLSRAITGFESAYAKIYSGVNELDKVAKEITSMKNSGSAYFAENAKAFLKVYNAMVKARVEIFEEAKKLAPFAK